MKFQCVKIIELGNVTFRQWKSDKHCKFIRGYRLIAKYRFGCTGLDDKDRVVDSNLLPPVKEILQTQFNHTLCISINDPLLEQFKILHNAGGCDLRIFKTETNFERFAEFCFNTADTHIRTCTVGRCWVEEVEIFEHNINSCVASYSMANSLPVSKNILTPPIVLEQPEHKEPEKTPTLNPLPQTDPKPVPIRNPVTTGWSNPFAGTSWGA